MRVNSDKYFHHTTKADKKFLGASIVHPMTAFFIALPLSGQSNAGSYSIFHHNKDVGLRIDVKKYAGQFAVDAPVTVEFGFSLRRVLLYVFAKAFENEQKTIILLEDNSKVDALRKFGYTFAKTAMGKSHPFMKAIPSLDALSFSFSDHAINTELGFDDGTHLINRLLVTTLAYVKLVYKKNHPENYESFLEQTGGMNDAAFCINPFFAFNVALPVNFRHVIGTKQKNDFWNVYLFLVDLLPRIPKDKCFQISWELLNNIFVRRQSTPKFKYAFKKYLSKVFKLYPKAEDKVDVETEKKRVYFYYAPPPI